MCGIKYTLIDPTYMMKWTTAVLAAMSVSCSAAEKGKNPVEVGAVDWQRSYPVGLKAAQTSNKPLFLLFQEVPG